MLRLLGPIDNLPPGYLFLCPLSTLQTEVPTCFRSRACAAYWALDPLGTEWLNTEEARNLGFPDIELGIEVLGRHWERSVYDGIRQFHEVKCFDPYSQDAALEAGFPLYQVTCERDVLLRGNNANDSYPLDGERFSESGSTEYESAVGAVPDVGIVLEFDDVAEDVSPSAQIQSTPTILPATSECSNTLTAHK
ncbi:hypothetical protein B0H14DRAFT_2549678, partial [Mycena olivaceomarginata]